jgi:hypothetical protein
MPGSDLFQGPLHLQGFLGDCPDELRDVITGSVEHPVSHCFGLDCSCKPSVVTRVLDEAANSQDPVARQLAQAHRARLEHHHLQRRKPSGFHPAVGPKSAALQPCNLFAIETNEEEGVVRGFCRRCERLFVLFDMALYWGIKRDTPNPPETWPYGCVCGGHGFQVGLGFDYTDDAMDTNDFHTITIALKCAACGKVAVILDEEG